MAGDEFLARKRVHLESGNQGQVRCVYGGRGEVIKGTVREAIRTEIGTPSIAGTEIE